MKKIKEEKREDSVHRYKTKKGYVKVTTKITKR